jgi:hypothetical protein
VTEHRSKVFTKLCVGSRVELAHLPIEPDVAAHHQ